MHGSDAQGGADETHGDGKELRIPEGAVVNSGGREHADHAPAEQIKTEEAAWLQHGKHEMPSTAKVREFSIQRIEGRVFEDLHLKAGSVALFLGSLPGAGMAENVIRIGREEAVRTCNGEVGAQAQRRVIESEDHVHSVAHCNAKSRALTLRE